MINLGTYLQNIFFQIKLSSLLIILSSVISIFSISMCSNESPPYIPKYHLIEKCHRSVFEIVAKANYTSLTRCQRFGIEKKALALNFSPPEVELEGEEPLAYTCEVLKCSEADGGLSLINDTRYDYYSIYARPLPHVNSTCVPGIGMFHLLQENQNFTQSLTQCRNMSGVLADVVSEQRTDALAQMLAGASVDAAVIGMRRNNTTGFYRVNGDSLECATYRAWAPGHPRRNPDQFDCVALTKNRTWRSISCQNSIPILCELIASGPYKRGTTFASKHPE